MVIVQETVPAYRMPFFERLRDGLADFGTGLLIVTAQGGVAGASRSTSGDSLVRGLPMWTLGRAPISATYLRLAGVLDGADLIVAEQALRHIETYGVLTRQAFGGTPIALWGHGRTLVKESSVLSRWALRRMTNRAHWFFAYTEGASAAVVSGGFPSERVTVVQNAIDTEDLVSQREAITDDEVARLRRDLRLPEDGVCLFVGTLSAAKRLKFLLAACEQVAGYIPDFTLVVAGTGAETEFMESAVGKYSWLRYVGPADTKQKALLATVSDVLLSPGRVGLIAVDSFATRTPIVTTNWPFHGPEFEYLADGRNAIVTDNDTDAYAHAVERILGSPDLLESLRRGCDADARQYTLERMVGNFSEGVLTALAAPRRGHVS